MLTAADFEQRRARLAQMPRVPRRELLAHQGELLRRLVRHAYQRVPYYRELFTQSGVRPEQISSVADLQRLPISSRQELQAADSSRIVAAGVDAAALLVERSSGASGMPMVVRHTPTERALYLLFRTRTFALLSERFGGRLTYVGLDNRAPEQKGTPYAGGLTVIECRQPLPQIVRELVAARPDVLVGYPGVLSEVAQEAAAEDVARVRPRLIVTSGEVLTPVVRSLLGQAFGAPVTTTYASTECFWMGGECPVTQQLHLLDDSLVLEVLDEAGQSVAPGAEGQVVVTSLHSFAQPFIRYRIGDVAVQGRAPMGGEHGCSCGSPFSTLGAVRGRMLDYLSLPGGRRVHSYELSLPLRDGAPFLQRYQIVQETIDCIRVRMVCQRSPQESELAALRARLGEVLGRDILIALELVDELEREASGKFRVVISHAHRPELS